MYQKHQDNLILLLIIVAIIGILFAQPLPFHTAVSEIVGPDASKITDWIIAGFTMLIAYYTLGLKDATIKLHNVTKDLVKGSEDTAQKQLRAYIFPDTKEEPIIDIDGLYFKVNWINSGATPAKNLVVRFNWKTFEGDMPENFDFPDLSTTSEDLKAILGPQSSNPQLVKISQENIENVAAQTRTLYIYGWADYNDVFKGTDRHRTEFCNKIDIKKFPMAGNPLAFRYQMLSTSFSKFNGADEECMHKPK